MAQDDLVHRIAHSTPVAAHQPCPDKEMAQRISLLRELSPEQLRAHTVALGYLDLETPEPLTKWLAFTYGTFGLKLVGELPCANGGYLHVFEDTPRGRRVVNALRKGEEDPELILLAAFPMVLVVSVVLIFFDILARL